MLVEDTGKHFLDSGGESGRVWQHNQGRDFKSEPSATVDFKYGYVYFTHNVYHWLVERLDYNQAADNAFRKWATDEENSDKSWFRCVDEFLEMLGEIWINEEECEVYPTIAGLYGDGEPMTVNTYNGEDLLSQIIQYTYVTVEDSNVFEDGIYIFLSIHGGCDARGGYTAHRVFNPTDTYEEEAILFNTDGIIYCPNCHEHWWTNDGYRWHEDGSGQDLDKHDVVYIGNACYKSIDDGVLHAHTVLNQMIQDNIKHTLVINGNDAYCPKCGQAVLTA